MFYNFLRPVDLFLLDKVFEPLSGWLFKKLNLSNFTLARWVFMFWTAGLLLAVYVLFTTPLVGRLGQVAVSMRNLLALFILYEFSIAVGGLMLASRLEKEDLRSDRLPPNRRSGNLPEVRDRYFYLLISLVLGPLILINQVSLVTLWIGSPDVLRVLSWVPILAGFYFLGCTPRRPRRATKKVSSHTALAPVRANT